SGWVTSAMNTSAEAPIIFTVSSAIAFEVLALTITEAPAAASERQMARPMLRAPPVTSATLPASSPPGLIPTLLGKSPLLSVHRLRQPRGERRNIDHHQDQQHDAGDERHAGQVDVL